MTCSPLQLKLQGSCRYKQSAHRLFLEILAIRSALKRRFVILSNAIKKLKASLELAAHVQKCLLPRAPRDVRGLDISFQTLYCEELGGDYCDFFPVAEAEGAYVGSAQSGRKHVYS
jgi:serine phosphatase RsbU (regulator of sigma subunit)